MLPLPSDISIRAARPEDAEPLLQVLCAAFGLDQEAARPLFYRDPYYDLSLKRVLATPDNSTVACLTVIPATLLVRGVPLQAGGIAGVATHPSHQRQGYASLLLAETVRGFADARRFPISALFAYSDSFYRRLGWETAARPQRWEGTISAPAGTLGASYVRRIFLENEGDRHALDQIRAALPPEQTGLCRRDTRRWRVLEMTTAAWEWHLYEKGGICSGYVALQHSGDADDPVVIHEMLAANAEARQALTAYLAYHTAAHAGFCWATSPDQPAAFGLSQSQAIETEESGMMLRLVDLDFVLRALHPVFAPTLQQDGRTLTMIASDPLCPQNNHPRRLTLAGITDGTDDDLNCLHAPIGSLAPIFTGSCLPSDLAERGELQASSPAALALADKLFPLAYPFVAPADQF